MGEKKDPLLFGWISRKQQVVSVSWSIKREKGRFYMSSSLEEEEQPHSNTEKVYYISKRRGILTNYKLVLCSAYI